MAVITNLLSSMAERAVVYKPALPITNFPKRPTPPWLYTATSIRLSTHASKNATHQSLRLPLPPRRKSEDQDQDQSEQGLTWQGYENILKLSEDEEPVADIDEWKLTEYNILQELRPMACFVRKILNSKRYKDGELLSIEDEIKIVEKLLPYHPHFEDKKGCGIDAIMVGRHREFKSRCLFIIQRNGRYTDFSYQKCLQGFIRNKYPSSAEKFISIHFKCNTYPLLKSS